jgi:hypothetical protein
VRARAYGRFAVLGAALAAQILPLGAAWADRDDRAHRHVPVDARSGQPLYGCEYAVDHGPYRNLVKQTDPPDGAAVRPGEEITVELSWSRKDYDAPVLHKVLDCVTVNGRLSYALSGGEKPTANDGHFTYRYTVPSDAPPGTVVCDVGFLTGPRGSEDYAQEESRRVCFTVEQPRPSSPVPAPPAAPEEKPAPVVESKPKVEASLPVTQTTMVQAPQPAITMLPRTGAGTGSERLGALCLAVAGLGGVVRRRAVRAG